MCRFLLSFAFFAATVLAAVMSATPARAQDPSLEPVSGSSALASGFTPDPFQTAVSAGGSTDARAAGGPACTGFVADAPSFRLFYAAGEGAPLILSLPGPAPGLILVNTPDGRWTCASSAAGARLRLERPASGQYDVWIGRSASGARDDTRLQISELAAP